MMKGLRLKGNVWQLRKSINGYPQREISLRTNSKKKALTIANRFIKTATSRGWDEAEKELLGHNVIKSTRGQTSIDEICEMYDNYCRHSERAPKPKTAKTNKSMLRLIAKSTKSKTVEAITLHKLQDYRKHYLQNADTKNRNPDSAKRSLASQYRMAKSIFKVSCLNYYTQEYRRNITSPFSTIESPKVKAESYTPLSSDTRKALTQNIEETNDSYMSMMFQLALFCGMRRNEIDKARISWLGKQKDHTILTIQRESDFIPKSKQNRQILIPHDLHDKLLSARQEIIAKFANSTHLYQRILESPYLIPTPEKIKNRATVKSDILRLDTKFRAFVNWLRENGFPDSNSPIHSLRKEFGALVATKHGLYAASVLLGHASYQVTIDHYAALVEQPTIDINALI